MNLVQGISSPDKGMCGTVEPWQRPRGVHVHGDTRTIRVRRRGRSFQSGSALIAPSSTNPARGPAYLLPRSNSIIRIPTYALQRPRLCGSRFGMPRSALRRGPRSHARHHASGIGAFLYGGAHQRAHDRIRSLDLRLFWLSLPARTGRTAAFEPDHQIFGFLLREHSSNLLR